MEQQLKEIKNIEDIKLLYYRYKDTPVVSLGVVILIVLIGFLLLGRVVLPQVENWLSIREEITKTKANIASMEKIQAFLMQQTNASLDKDFVVASHAVPIEKDFAGILSAINVASTKAGVALDDFSFEVGDLSTKSAKLTPQTSLSVGLTLQGNLVSVKSFLKEISEKVPLSEVINLDYSNESARVSLIFFYSVLPERVPIMYSEPLPTLTPELQILLRKFEEWKGQTETQSTTPNASSSGVPEPF